MCFTEFILGIYQNQATFCSHLCSAFEQCQSVFFQRFVFFRSSESLSQDFFFGDIFIVQSHFCFCSRSDNGVRELFVFTHTFGQTDTADFANAAFISTPCTSAEGYPRTIISTGNPWHITPTVTIGSGVASFQFGQMSVVASRNLAAIWFSICPLYGIPSGRTTSNAEIRSVATITNFSSPML